MKTIYYIFACWGLLLLLCCKPNPRPGYKYAAKGIYYKLVTFDADTVKIKHGDVVTAVACIYNSKHEKLFDSNSQPNETIVFTVDSSDHVLNSRFKKTMVNFGKGDSVSVLMDTGRVTKRLEIKIADVQSAMAYKQLKQQTEAFGDIYEYLQTKAYIKKHKITISPVANGLYIIPIQLSAHQNPIQIGDKVRITYKGYFMNGYCFDALHAEQALDFIYGNDFQVIKGLEIAIGTMHEGDESKIIIPSHLAYGEKGSSTGIIPPYTSLIYSIKIINVN